MKKLILLPLFLLFAGCVSYYTPVNAVEDGVYYAEDDPDYNNTAYVYNSASYYPWASLDYFYMGAAPFYPSYSYGFGGYVGGGFSIGFSSGYSPWYAPYYGYYQPYGYYSPWYGYGYPRYGYGYPRYGYGQRNYACGYGYNYGNSNCYHGNRGGHYANGGNGYNRGKGHNGERYTGNDRDNRGNTKRGNGGNGNRTPGDARKSEDYARQPNNKGGAPGRDRSSDSLNGGTARYVSTSPDSQAGNQGVVVRSRADAKQPQYSRTHEVRNQTATNKGGSRTTPAPPVPVGQPQQQRYEQYVDKGRSRTMPVQRPVQQPGRQPLQQAQQQAGQQPRQQPQAAPVARTDNAPANGRTVATQTPAGQASMPSGQRAPQQSKSRSNQSRSTHSSTGRSSAKKPNRDQD